MQTSSRRRLTLVSLACLALGACQQHDAPSQPPATQAPLPAPATVAPAVSEADRLMAAARAAFAAGRFVAPADDNALAWFAAVRESDPDHPGAIEALVELYPIAVAAAERALDAGDAAEARRIVDLLERVEPGSLGARRLRERIDAAPGASNPAEAVPRAVAPAAPAAPAEPPAREASAPAPTPPPSAPLPSRAEGPSPGQPVAPDPSPVQVGRPPAPASSDGPGAAQQTPARVLQRVEPAYPQLARQRRIEGWVELEFTVDTDGTPSDIRVVESSPNAMFDVAATRALQRWRFEPARRGTQAEASRTRTRILFRLS